MAKIISKKRRRGGAKKAAKSAARRVIVQTKKVYKRAKGINVTTKDVVISVAAGGAGAIGSAIVIDKLPATINDTLKNAIVTAAGGFLAYKGVKKRNMALTGAGMGMAAVGAAKMAKQFIPNVPALGAPFTNPMLAAPIRMRRTVGAPFTKPVALRGCAKVADEDYI
jgi:hypothetical protein